jgi:hypothetical protein
LPESLGTSPPILTGFSAVPNSVKKILIQLYHQGVDELAALPVSYRVDESSCRQVAHFINSHWPVLITGRHVEIVRSRRQRHNLFSRRQQRWTAFANSPLVFIMFMRYSQLHESAIAQTPAQFCTLDLGYSTFRSFCRSSVLGSHYRGDDEANMFLAKQHWQMDTLPGWGFWSLYGDPRQENFSIVFVLQKRLIRTPYSSDTCKYGNALHNPGTGTAVSIYKCCFPIKNLFHRRVGIPGDFKIFIFYQ